MEVNQAINQRRSIRRFQDKPVPYEILEKCVDAGRLAPTARNRQLCEYVIVDDPEMMPDMFDYVKAWGYLEKPENDREWRRIPKAYIVILINSTLEAEIGTGRRKITLIDVGMAGENIVLAAREQGIGTCPALLFKEASIKKLLNIPENYDVALVITAGYPDESPVAEPFTGSVDSWLDEDHVRHVPKRNLKDITHRNSFA